MSAVAKAMRLTEDPLLVALADHIDRLPADDPRVLALESMWAESALDVFTPSEESSLSLRWHRQEGRRYGATLDDLLDAVVNGEAKFWNEVGEEEL